MKNLGLYDTIHTYQRCPYCKRFSSVDAQTKDLGKMMYSYCPLDEDWFKKNKLGKDFREQLSTSKAFPFDKSHKVWKNQAERIEARAKVSKEFSKLKFVSVIADCHSHKCQEWSNERWTRIQGIPSVFGRAFEGKIKIKNGMLFGDIYDIELIQKRLPMKRKKKKVKK